MSKRFDFSGSPQTSFFKRIRIHPSFPFWMRQIGVFFWFLMLIFSLSVSFSVLSSAKGALGNFHFPKISYDRPKNIEELQNDIQSFVQEVEPLLNQVESVLPPNQYSYQAEILTSFHRFLNNLLILQKVFPEFESSLEQGLHTGNFDPFLVLTHQQESVLLALHSDAIFLFEHVKNIPILSQKLSKYDVLFSEWYPLLESFPQTLSALYALSGDSQPHHVLILFQNRNEKRATGGFIGSFGDLVLNDGKIASFSIQDIYQYDGQMEGFDQIPELAKTLVGEHKWSLRDSNYHPVFSVSAQTFMNMYEAAGGETIDTIIAIDQTLIESLLDMVGGIDLPEYGIHLNSKNFAFVLSYIVEGKFNQGSPKSFLSDKIFPLLKESFAKKISYSDLFRLYRNQKSHIQIFSNDASVNRLGRTLGIGKNIEAILQDFSQILLSEISISGNKSDAYVSKEQDIRIEPYSGKNKVIISYDRFHNWNAENEISYEYLKKHIGIPLIPEVEHKNILGKGTNHEILQFFLPAEVSDIHCSQIESFRSFPLGKKQVLELVTTLLPAGEKQSFSCSFFLPASFKKITIADS